MKRLLAYLFVFLGLALMFNVNVQSSHKYGHVDYCVKKKGDHGKWPFYSTTYGKCPKKFKKVSKYEYETFKKKIDEKYVPKGVVSKAPKEGFFGYKPSSSNIEPQSKISFREIKKREAEKNKISSKKNINKILNVNDYAFYAFEYPNSLTMSLIYETRTYNKSEAILLLENGECKFGSSLDKLVENSKYETTFDFKCSYRVRDNNIHARINDKVSISIYPNKNKVRVNNYMDKTISKKRISREILSLAKFYNANKLIKQIMGDKNRTQIAKAEPDRTQEVSKSKQHIDLIFCKYNEYLRILDRNKENCSYFSSATIQFSEISFNEWSKYNQNNNICYDDKKILSWDFLVTKKNCEFFKRVELKYDGTNFYYEGSEQKTQIAKAEPTITPKKKGKVAMVEEPKQEEFKPENKDIDNDAPVIEVAQNITVDSQAYTLKGKVKDKSQIYLTIDGRQVQVKKGKFELERFNIDPDVAEEIKIVAIDKWNNRSEKTIKVTIDLEATDTAKVYEDLNPNKVKVKTDKNKIAIIIGIEKYENLTNLDAKYANRDAKAFRAYATRALGIKPSNLKILIDDKATRSQVLKAFKLWLPKIAGDGGKDIHLFFAGHGLASDNGEDLYILPQDGESSLLEDTAISRVELISLINKVSPRSVTMFFDTCYSGQTRDERMLVASLRPIRIVADEQDTPTNFTIFTASNYDQTSGSIEEAKHGMFSYYLMKGLEGKADENEDKKITNGELIAYLKDNVSQEAFTQNRQQDPMLAGDPDKVLMSYR